jgi:hypothetical protein
MNKRIAVSIVLSAPFLLFLVELFSGQSIFWGLPILQFYPWRTLAFDQILNGQLPLWNPYNGLGTPLLANYQSALLYPGTWIIFLFYIVGKLPGMVFGHLFINILHLSIAAYGVYKLAQEYKFSQQASVISAVSYSLSGYLLARFGFFSMIWAAAWFPWVFLYTINAYKSGKFSVHTIKLASVIALMLLSGHAQLSWYCLLFSGIYLLFKFHKPLLSWWKGVLQFVIASLMAVGISAIQLLPTAELLLHSQRSAEVDAVSSMTYSFWPWHFLNFINPHIFGHPIHSNYWGYGAYWEDAVYIGLLPVLLGLAAIIIHIRKKHSDGIQKSDFAFFGVISLLSLIFSLGANTPLFPWLYKHIPTFDMFNAPARYIIWLVFSLALMAGFTFDRWRKPLKRTLYWVRLGTAGGFAIGIGAFYMLLSSNDIKQTFIAATFEISLIVTLIGILYLFNPISNAEVEQNRKEQIWKWVVVGFILLDIFFMNYRHTPVQKIGTINIYKRMQVMPDSRIYVPEAIDYEFRYNTTLNFEDYHNTLPAKDLSQSALANINIFSQIFSLNNFEPMRLKDYDDFISVLNKRSYQEQKEIVAAYGVNRFGSIDGETSSEINYESIAANYPIQAYSTIQLADSMDSIMHQTLKSPCIYVYENEFEHQEKISSNCTPIDADVTELIWSANKISFVIDMPLEGWVLINDTYDTGWQLKIDDQTSEIYKANGFVKAFKLTSGNHIIQLNYLPKSFIFGSLITLFSLILMCILVYRIRKAQ